MKKNHVSQEDEMVGWRRKLLTGLPGYQEVGNIKYRSHTIQCMLIMPISYNKEFLGQG